MMTQQKKLEFISRIPIGTYLIVVREYDYAQDPPSPARGVFAGIRMLEGKDMIWLTAALGSRNGELVAIEEIHNLGVELDPSLRPDQAGERVR